jgi:hypothetical protein
MRRRFVELAPWHVNGTVSAADRTWVDGYVRSHPQARAELEWYASLQQRIRADAPEVSPDAGLERLLHRVRLERPPPRPDGGLAWLLGPVRQFFAGIVMRPAFAYAAMALVVAQAGLIGALLFEQQATERDYAEYRSMATVPAGGPLLCVTFKAEAQELDIRGALVDVGGTLVGGPGQLGEYLVRVPPEKVEVAAARLRANAAVEAVEVSEPEPGPLPGQARSRSP